MLLRATATKREVLASLCVLDKGLKAGKEDQERGEEDIGSYAGGVEG